MNIRKIESGLLRKGLLVMATPFFVLGLLAAMVDAILSVIRLNGLSYLETWRGGKGP